LWDDVLSRVWTSGWNFSRVKIILHYRKNNSIRRWDFYKLPLQGAKLADYEDFKRAAELMKEKLHLTAPGLEDNNKEWYE
jgi:hypothetical protein